MLVVWASLGLCLGDIMDICNMYYYFQFHIIKAWSQSDIKLHVCRFPVFFKILEVVTLFCFVFNQDTLMKLERIEQKMSSLELFRKVDGLPASVEDVMTMMSEAKEHVGNLDDLVSAAKALVKPPAATAASARMSAFTL